MSEASPSPSRTVEPELAELAAAHGVAVSYRDADDTVVPVARDVVVDVLAALEVDAGGPAAIASALEHARAAADALPPVLVAGRGRRELPGPARLELEDGSVRDVAGELPADLPVGYHRLVVGRDDDEASAATGGGVSASAATGEGVSASAATGEGVSVSTVIVAPGPLDPPPPTWGWTVQLYALRSAGSWGCGDLSDLGTVLRRTADEQGAGALLCNPLHALALAPRVEPSPYSPASRRFLHPVSIRVADTAAYAAAPPEVRAEVDGLRPRPIEGGTPIGDPIDYDAVWAAKSAALERLRPWAPDDVTDVEALDPELRDVATWYALAELHGAAWRCWPTELRSPDAPGVAAARAELADRVGFHAWCQRLADTQLAAAREAAGGMAVGLIADLAVGCSAQGADAWALRSALADGVTVGAPPDAFNQQGQDWSLPPWRPDALAAAGYAPLRSMIRAVLRHGDGIRVDHVAGLWRLWWIPPGRSAREGTYVHYDADAMLAVVAIEARRAGAVVVGEDLGTVEPEVTAGLTAAGMLGCAVLWFQRDAEGALLDPRDWHRETLASLSTHDLPTAVGFLRDEHVRARAAAGLLDDPAEAAAQAARDRDELLGMLVAHGLLGSSRPHTEREIVTAMHGLLARARSRIVLAAFTDVVDEVRQPNLPGTVDAYPNWRIPLPLSLEDLLDDPRVREVASLLSARGGPARH